MPSGTGQSLRGLWTRPGQGEVPGDAWAVDREGTLLRFDGTSWLELPHDSAEEVSISAVHASPRGDVWAVGRGGTIQHWDGKALKSQVSGTTKKLLGVWSNGPDDVWAVGEQATALHLTGSKWVSVPAGIAATRPARELVGGGTLTPQNDLLGVWSSGGTTWVVGGPEFPDEGFVLRSTGGAFTPSLPAVKGRLLCIWGSGPRDVWAAGNNGLLMHFDGASWSSLPRQTTEALNSLWGSGPSDIWAAGNSGTLLHYDGKAWSIANTRTDGVIFKLFASGPRDVWATGYGPLRHFDGTTWQSLNVGSSAHLRGVWASDASHVWLAGENGTILNENYDSPLVPYTDPRRELSGKLPRSLTRALFESSTPIMSRAVSSLTGQSR